MQNNETLKDFGKRLRELRKQKKMTQKELAAKVDMQFPQLNRYECGLNNPPLQKLLMIAEALDTNVDYLLTGDRPNERPLHNIRLLKRFQELEQFETNVQETVIQVIDAMIVKGKMEGVMAPLDVAG